MDSSSRSKGSKNKVRLLSPIREVSGVIPVHVIPKGRKVMKGAGGHSPILVQALPPEAGHPKPAMKPSERHYTEVDQVVADYLHYARYGQVMPVVYGGGTGVGSIGSGDGLSCACCSDRNRDSMQKKIALARGEDIFQEDGKYKEPDSTPKDSPHKDPPEIREGPSQMPKTVIRGQPPHAQQMWGYYQPKPYAGTFLNPEFNRPFTLQTVAEDDGRRQRDEHNYINTKVLEANFKYDKSMEKLEAHLKNGFQLPSDAVFIDHDVA